MKLDRLAVLLAILIVLGACGSSKLTINVGGATATFQSHSANLAKAIAQQVLQVQQRFFANRNALRTVTGRGGKPAYLRQDVTGLITNTGDDLNQAIEKAGPSETEPLRAWSAEEVRRIQREIPPPGATASLPGSSAFRTIAVVASLRGGFGLPLLAKTKPAPKKPALPKPAAPQSETVSADLADRLLKQVGEMLNRIFTLADHRDLEVTLWVGSTPKQNATFRFWAQGSSNGAKSPMIIRTDSTQRNVMRGLYAYNAALDMEKAGAVTQAIDYPLPAGAPVAQASSPLDLVNGTNFFCCRFLKEGYCQHVNDEKTCH